MLSRISTFLKGVISGKTDVAEQPPVQTKEVPYKVEPTPVVQHDIMTGMTYVAPALSAVAPVVDTADIAIAQLPDPVAVPAKKQPAPKKAPAKKAPAMKTPTKVQTFTKAKPVKVKPTGALTKPPVKKRAPKPSQ